MEHDWQKEDVDFLAKSKSARKKASKQPPKSTSSLFRRRLKEVYMLEYGVTKNSDIAKIIDEQVGEMSAGRFSQVLSNRENLKLDTLRKILIPIKNEENRRLVINACFLEFFKIRPDVLPSGNPFGDTFTQEKFNYIAFCRNSGQLNRAGWMAYQATLMDIPPLWKYKLYRLGYQCLLRADRAGSALCLVFDWLESAVSRSEYDMIAAALHGRVHCLMTSGMFSVEKCLQINARATEILQSAPRSYVSPYKEISIQPERLEFQRIQVLVVGCERGMYDADRKELHELLGALDQIDTSPLTKTETQMVIEYRARINSLLGNAYQGSEELSDALQLLEDYESIRQDDVMLAKARLLRLTDNPEAAEAFVIEALGKIRHFENRLHFRMLDAEILFPREQEIEALL